MKIVIVDDSAITRGIWEKAFKHEGVEIAAMVSNGRKAVDFCRENQVDGVLSDYNMPEMNGVEATKILAREFGVPVVIYYEDTKIKADALDAGACLFLQKPSLVTYNQQMLSDFTQKVIDAIEKCNATSAAGANHNAQRASESSSKGSSKGAASESSSESSSKKSSRISASSLTETISSMIDENPRSYKILCIGASTGGPTAVQEVLLGLGKDFPLPILYTQHIDIGADEKMVKWFNQVCPNIKMSLPQDGEVARPGHVYMAAADTHLMIDYVKNDLPVLSVSHEPPERFLRPAVNKLFRSAAKHYKEECLAILLTGMGQDGAEGCKEIVDNGGFTICEDKSTCTVFGMPAAAIEMGAASRVLPRSLIARTILRMLR